MEGICLAAAAFYGVLTFWAYRRGIRDGMRIRDGKAPEALVRRPAAKPRESRELRRLGAILANVDAYDGTSAGQKEVR